MLKRIICLANSRKPGGRCVAGVDPEGGRWTRPISEREGQEVNAAERRYRDGTEPALLDIVEFSVVRHRPGPHQPENWTVDTSQAWQRVGQAAISDLDRYVERPVTLWSNYSSSSDGLCDRISEGEGVERSLHLIRVDRLVVDVHDVVTPFGSETKIKGEFLMNGTTYRLAVTDPDVGSSYLSRAGRHELGPAYVTVSLSEPFHGYCYKLIAAVILIVDE